MGKLAGGQLSEVFLFRALMSSTADSIYFKDRDCRYLRASKKMANDLGYEDPAGLVGKSDVDLFGQAFGLETRQDELRVMETDHPLVGAIESCLLPNGRHNWVLTTKLPMHDPEGNVIGLLGISREINEIREVEMALQYLATHDPLTDLPNRFLMTDRVNQLLTRSRGSGGGFALLFMDADEFKAVNDARGHEFGDMLLLAMGQRIVKSVRHGDTVARVGGDEFVVVLDTVSQIRDAATVAQHIIEALARPFIVEHHRVKITGSVGISIFPENGGDVDTLLKAADYAMYLAKREGGNAYAVCPPGHPHPGAHGRIGEAPAPTPR